MDLQEALPVVLGSAERYRLFGFLDDDLMEQHLHRTLGLLPRHARLQAATICSQELGGRSDPPCPGPFCMIQAFMVTGTNSSVTEPGSMPSKPRRPRRSR